MHPEMESLIWRCTTKVVKQLDVLHRPRSAGLGQAPVPSTAKFYFVGHGTEPGEPRAFPEAIIQTTLHPPFLSSLGDLVQKDNAQHSHTEVVVGGCTSAPALFDPGSDTRLVNSNDLAEVDRAMLILSKPLQIEPCNVSITSCTQNRLPVSHDLPDR